MFGGSNGKELEDDFVVYIPVPPKCDFCETLAACQ